MVKVAGNQICFQGC